MTNEELIKRITDVAYDHGHDICYVAADRIERLSLNNEAMLGLVLEMSSALYDCILEKRQLEKKIMEMNNG